MSETMDPRQRFLFSMLPGLLGQAYNYVRQNPLQATADVAQAVTPGGALQDALAGSGQISQAAMRGDIGGMVGGAGAMGAGLLGAIPIAGMVGRGVGAGVRAARESPEAAGVAGRVAGDLPNYRVTPQVNRPFDEWIDALYSPEVRGPGNIVTHPSIGYRGVSDVELQAAIKEGKFKPILGNDLFIERDPERYMGGGAYGAKRGGAIVQFNTNEIPVKEIKSNYVPGLVETGVEEIPLGNVSNIWRWNPETKTHNLLSQDALNEILKRYGVPGLLGAGAAGAGAAEMQQ